MARVAPGRGWCVRVASGRLGLLRGWARGGLLVNGVRPWRLMSRARPGLWLSRVRPGLWLGVVKRGLGADRAKDALGHGHQAVGAFPDLVELFEKPLDPVLEPFHGILTRTGTAVVAAGRRLGRPPGPWGLGRHGWPGRRRGSMRMMVRTAAVDTIGRDPLPPLLLVVEYPFGLGRFLRRVGGSLGGVGGFLRRLDLPLGRFGSEASVIGGGPGLIGPPHGPVDLRFVRPLLRHLGGFLGQIGGLLRRVGGLCQPFSALSRPLGPLARPVGQAPGPVGRLLGVEVGILQVVELGILQVVELGIARVGFLGHGV
jgi:hypothetical protein